MGFQANVLRVMIASPSDVKEEREIVTKQIHRWNDANAGSRNLILQPVKWETHSTPRLGAPAQDVLNEQILDDADILIGIFGTRLGTATANYVSGTVEEIKRHVAAGKTAKVYFSDAPIPRDQFDDKQFKALQEFKEECRALGLYATYTDLADFKDSVQQHLALELNQPRYLWLKQIAPLVPAQETELSDDAKKVLISAAAFNGQIATLRHAGGEIIHAGREPLGDGTAKASALWREVFQKLASQGLIEPGARSGNYELTAEGYRAVEKLKREEEAKKQLEIELKIEGAAPSQTLKIASNKAIRLRQVEYLTTSGVCTAHEDKDIEVGEEEAAMPIDVQKVIKLVNSPRSDRNPNDFSGPAIVRLTYAKDGVSKTLDLPIMLRPVFVSTGMNATTQYFTLSGQKRFYI